MNGKESKMVGRTTRKAVLLLASAALLAGCGQREAEREIVRPVRAMQVAGAGALQERWFPGRAQATQEVNLAFEVPGQLIARPVGAISSLSSAGGSCRAST